MTATFGIGETMTKPILELAKEITSGDRRRDYGRPLVNHLRIALMWSIQDEKPVSPIEVAWKMITLKAAREIHTPKYDNLLDTIGYAACVDDMGLQAMELGMADSVEEGIKFLRHASVGQMFELMLLAKAADEDARKSDKERELERMDAIMALDISNEEMIEALARQGYSVRKQQVVTVTPATSLEDMLQYLERSGTIVKRPTELDEIAYKAGRQLGKTAIMTEAVQAAADAEIAAHINQHYEGISYQQLRSVMPETMQNELDRLTRDVAEAMNNEREIHVKVQVLSHLTAEDMVKELNRRGIDLKPKTQEWRDGMPLEEIMT